VRPPRYGLLAAAAAVDDGERWEMGFTFTPEACGTSGRETFDRCQWTTNEMDPDRPPAAVTGDAFVVWAGERCSTIGYAARDWQARARRQLEATRSYEVANELWTGDLLAADPDMEGRALTDARADVLTNGATSIVAALSCLDAGLTVCGRGRQGMIHVTPQVHAHAVAAQWSMLSGTTWMSPNGHIVVADAGYTGEGPADNVNAAPGASQWAYATSLIAVRLGEVRVTPPAMDADGLPQTMTPATNSLFVLAMQPAAYQWDECCHLAAQIDLATCLVGGAS
jgi:hypothetical protein